MVDSLNLPLVNVGFQAKDAHSNTNMPHFVNLYELFDRLARQFAKRRDAAVLAERNRMAREIHDTVAQGFIGVMMQLAAAEEALSRNLAAEATDHIGRACELARESLHEARRSVGALRSKALEEKNLCEAMNESVKKMTEGTTLRAKFIYSGERRKLPFDLEENLLRIGQEALTNTIRHAHATEFKKELVFDKQEVRLFVRDNGCGFEPAGPGGFGLRGMRERVESMGGRFSIQSAKGMGTLISIFIPVCNIAKAA